MNKRASIHQQAIRTNSLMGRALRGARLQQPALAGPKLSTCGGRSGLGAALDFINYVKRPVEGLNKARSWRPPPINRAGSTQVEARSHTHNRAAGCWLLASCVGLGRAALGRVHPNGSSRGGDGRRPNQPQTERPWVPPPRSDAQPPKRPQGSAAPTTSTKRSPILLFDLGGGAVGYRQRVDQWGPRGAKKGKKASQRGGDWGGSGVVLFRSRPPPRDKTINAAAACARHRGAVWGGRPSCGTHDLID